MSNDTFTLPAGDYIIGDPCYNIRDVGEWDRVSDTLGQSGAIPFMGEDGKTYKLVAFGIESDGEYTDREGRKYSVDTALLGIIPRESVEAVDEATHVVTFVTSFECSMHDGVILFGDIEINTNDEADFDEDFEPEYDDEGGDYYGFND